MLDAQFEAGPHRARSAEALSGQSEDEACSWVFDNAMELGVDQVVLMPGVVDENLERDEVKRA